MDRFRHICIERYKNRSWFMPVAKHTVCSQEAKRGRPRTFDPDRALDTIVDVFWENGYAGTSYKALVRATGINQPSLYAAFGDKDALFEKALDRYFNRYGRPGLAPLLDRDADTPSVIAAWFRVGAYNLTDRSHPSGCLIVGTVGESGGEGKIGRHACRCLAATETALRQCLENGILNGSIVQGTDVAALARALTVAWTGMGMFARSGASRDQLIAVAETIVGLVPDARSPTGKKQGPADA
ncbi:MAG: TetR/AcrR family transcriptional regulator [Pseudomonadota bacterium]